MGNHSQQIIQTNPALQYNFILDGGRSNQLLSLVNPTTAPVTVQAIQITTNAVIANPWLKFGDQWNNVQVTQQGNFYIYTLNLAQPISIVPGQNNVLEYSVGKALGPITNVAMPPQQIQIKLQGQSAWQAVNFASTNPQPNPHPNMELDVYHAEWGQYAYQQTMASEAWTDINNLSYAFIGFDGNGNVFSLDNWADQLELPTLALYKKQFTYLKSLLSFGGWTNNNQMMAPVFSQMAANSTALNNFVNNAVAAVVQAGADGVNIDWEYPASAEDAANYIKLLQQLRNKLPAGARLTIAAPAGIDKINVFTTAQWQQIAGLVDRISVMNYDYFGAFSSYSDFHSAWQLSPNSPYYSVPVSGQYCVEKTLAAYQALGIPMNKLAMGIPNYSRSMIVNQAGDYAGLYQPVVGAPQGDFQGANGVYSWNSIQAFLNKQSSPLDALGVKEWNYYNSTHPLCIAANMCLLSGQLPNGQWVVINFPDPVTTNWRARQAVTMGLGGAMIWANYFESTNPANKIVDAVSAGLNNTLIVQQTHETKSVPVATQLYTEECVHNHANNLRNVFFGKRKQKVLNQLVEAKSAIQTAEIINNNKRILSRHRNIFKWALSAILPEAAADFLLGKPESLNLAERLLAARTVIEKTNPTRIISVDKNKPDVVKAAEFSSTSHAGATQLPSSPLLTATQLPSAPLATVTQLPSAPPAAATDIINYPITQAPFPHAPQLFALPNHGNNSSHPGSILLPPTNPELSHYPNVGNGQVAPAYYAVYLPAQHLQSPAHLAPNSAFYVQPQTAHPHVAQTTGVSAVPPPTFTLANSISQTSLYYRQF